MSGGRGRARRGTGARRQTSKRSSGDPRARRRRKPARAARARSKKISLKKRHRLRQLVACCSMFVAVAHAVGRTGISVGRSRSRDVEAFQQRPSRGTTTLAAPRGSRLVEGSDPPRDGPRGSTGAARSAVDVRHEGDLEPLAQAFTSRGASRSFARCSSRIAHAGEVLIDVGVTAFRPAISTAGLRKG